MQSLRLLPCTVRYSLMRVSEKKERTVVGKLTDQAVGQRYIDEFKRRSRMERGVDQRRGMDGRRHAGEEMAEEREV